MRGIQAKVQRVNKMRLISEFKQRSKQKRRYASAKAIPFQATKERLSFVGFAESKSPRDLAR